MSGRRKYTQDERLKIGRRIAEHEISIYAAAVEYEINPYTARDYMRLYKASKKVNIPNGEYEKYMNLSREQLIDDLIRAKRELDELKK